MLSVTKGIVLHHVKYGESSVIATIYTEKFGRQSYIVNSVRSRKARNKALLLQPLCLLELVAYQKQSRDVQRLKELRLLKAFRSIPFDIKKSSQAIFIAEILYKVLKEEESNPQMFRFLEQAIAFLDLITEGTNNFHLYFLSRLTEFLGISPNSGRLESGAWLDMEQGIAQPFKPDHPKFMDKEETEVFLRLSKLELNKFQEITVTKNLRKKLLVKILEYYQLHFDWVGRIKSLEVLNETFE